MQIEIDLIQTLVVAITLLFVGGFLNSRVGFLGNNNIPVPVTGGILFAVVTSVLFTQLDMRISFDMAMKAPLMLAFFTTVGLGAGFGLLAKGGVKIVVFLAVVTAFLVVQNTVGLLMALGLDLHPLVGLLSGSVTLSGGHGTGAAYAARFTSIHNLQGAMELAMACATVGLVIGGIMGGPVADRLISRFRLAPADSDQGERQAESLAEKENGTISPQKFLETLFMVLVCLIGGAVLSGYLDDGSFTLPVFIWALLIGIAIRNICEFTGIYRIDQASLQLIASVSLSLFLAMALMSLKLWELVSLAGPMLAIIAAHTVVLGLFTYFVTFRVMGGTYDAAVMAGGHCGFGMGATPTAVANMDAITDRFGASPQAFLIIPMVGAFFIDITNALVIQAFLALPVFGF